MQNQRYKEGKPKPISANLEIALHAD